MITMNRATLSRIEKMKKCGDENANKWQKHDDMVAQPGKKTRQRHGPKVNIVVTM